MNDLIMNEDQAPLERRADELRLELLKADKNQLAFTTSTTFEEGDGGTGSFTFPYWGNQVVLSSEDYIARDPVTQRSLPPIHQAMILYYFFTSRSSPPSGGWISFSELADGQFYNAAFQGYTAKKILQHFNQDYQAFEDKCLELSGEKISFGDGAFKFRILPQVAILLVYWKGDDEFPPSYKILFEDTADYHLPTDACAILGSMLVGKLQN
ncbi:MAG: DUF3786 domain-containing protein [Anaerolineales bacterium]|nr:DUF3786 domain-containing protein [Anaerolineales bacterium]